jgi:hypothetical protein
MGLLQRARGHWLSRLGTLAASGTGLGILILALWEAVAAPANQYASFFMLLTLTGGFVAGLLLTLMGVRRTRKTGALPQAVSSTAPEVANRVAFMLSATLLIIAILGVAGQGTVRTMDTPVFCGTACHVPMAPEWEAYQVSPHSRVPCVNCHVGSGTVWGVRAKLDGSRRLVALLLGDYSRPIATPVVSMRASQATCKKCHSIGAAPDKVKVFPHYGSDRENTPSFSVALLKLGGVTPTGASHGIHSHDGARRTIRYEMLDETRTRLGRITVAEDGKPVAVYQRNDVQGAPLGEREMDCMDCHNQPSHRFSQSAQTAVDEALASGRLDSRVPYARSTAVKLLTSGTPTREDAVSHFVAAVRRTYERDYPGEHTTQADQQKLALGLAAVYRRNIFPDMNVTWGTYPSHMNHVHDQERTGCFRCHNSSYEATMLAPGRTGKLGQRCEACHTMLVVDENPAEMEEPLNALVPHR